MGVTMTCGPGPGILNSTVSPSWRLLKASRSECSLGPGDSLFTVSTVSVAADKEKVQLAQTKASAIKSAFFINNGSGIRLVYNKNLFQAQCFSTGVVWFK